MVLAKKKQTRRKKKLNNSQNNSTLACLCNRTEMKVNLQNNRGKHDQGIAKAKRISEILAAKDDVLEYDFNGKEYEDAQR